MSKVTEIFGLCSLRSCIATLSSWLSTLFWYQNDRIVFPPRMTTVNPRYKQLIQLGPEIVYIVLLLISGVYCIFTYPFVNRPKPAPFINYRSVDASRIPVHTRGR